MFVDCVNRELVGHTPDGDHLSRVQVPITEHEQWRVDQKLKQQCAEGVSRDAGDEARVLGDRHRIGRVLDEDSIGLADEPVEFVGYLPQSIHVDHAEQPERRRRGHTHTCPCSDW